MVNYFSLKERQGEIRQLATPSELEGNAAFLCVRAAVSSYCLNLLQVAPSRKAPPPSLQGCFLPHLTGFIKESSF